MFGFLWTELLTTKDELKYNDARAALETAGLRYRTYQQSPESTQLAAASMSHGMHRPKNPAAYSWSNPGLGDGTVREVLHDGHAEDVAYILEVRKKDLAEAKKLVG